MSADEQWRIALWALRTECPIRRRVRVRRVKMPKADFGDCALFRGVYTIRVSSRISIDFALWVLAHEWGHAMAWPVEEDHDAHHAICWGRAHAAIEGALERCQVRR